MTNYLTKTFVNLLSSSGESGIGSRIGMAVFLKSGRLLVCSTVLSPFPIVWKTNKIYESPDHNDRSTDGEKGVMEKSRLLSSQSCLWENISLMIAIGNIFPVYNATFVYNPSEFSLEAINSYPTSETISTLIDRKREVILSHHENSREI